MKKRPREFHFFHCSNLHEGTIDSSSNDLANQRWDFALLILGFIGAVGHGLLVPATAFLLGEVIDALNSPDVLNKMTDLIGYFVIIGLIEASSGFCKLYLLYLH